MRGSLEGERGFWWEAVPSPRGEAPFDFTMRFHSARWSPTTNRSAGPAAIRRYLEVFNADNDAPASDYRNVEGKGSKSASAPYLVKLFREIKAAKVAGIGKK